MPIRDPERYFDRRTIKRHLKRGHASEEDYKAWLTSLPDLTDNIKAKDEGGDDDGFEARMHAKAKRGQPGDAEARAEAAPAADSPAPAEPAAPAPAEPAAPAPAEAAAPVAPSAADVGPVAPSAADVFPVAPSPDTPPDTPS